MCVCICARLSRMQLFICPIWILLLEIIDMDRFTIKIFLQPSWSRDPVIQKVLENFLWQKSLCNLFITVLMVEMEVIFLASFHCWNFRRESIPPLSTKKWWKAHTIVKFYTAIEFKIKPPKSFKNLPPFPHAAIVYLWKDCRICPICILETANRGE